MSGYVCAFETTKICQNGKTRTFPHVYETRNIFYCVLPHTQTQAHNLNSTSKTAIVFPSTLFVFNFSSFTSFFFLLRPPRETLWRNEYNEKFLVQQHIVVLYGMQFSPSFFKVHLMHFDFSGVGAAVVSSVTVATKKATQGDIHNTLSRNYELLSQTNAD